MKPANKKYPTTTRELLDYLKEKQHKRDEKVVKLIKHLEKETGWPMEFSRLELAGRRVRSVVLWECPNCYSDGVAHSEDRNGHELPCWHCSQCDSHADFHVITDGT